MATIYGDMAGTLDTRAKGQTLVGIDGVLNIIYGDSFNIENRQGGNDVLIGGKGNFNNFLYGDAEIISCGQGGNDVITGGLNGLGNFLYGDAGDMYHSWGGNDTLVGGVNSRLNNLYGDAYAISDSKGGNDVLTGGDSSDNNHLYGDAYVMSGSQGGNDALTGGNNSMSNILYGDAYAMSGGQGGNDALMGGKSALSNVLYGDAYAMSGGKGGNDILIAGDTSVSSEFVSKNTLYGDAQYHSADNIVCGNDRLISGTGNDDMWGDIAYSGFANGPLDLTRVTTGNDVFVFSANNGNDTIYDFRHGEDKIELKGIGVDSFDALIGQSHLSQESTNAVITFGSNTITVIGVTELTAADFLFT